MAPFYGWGSTASRLQPLRGGSLLLTIQFPEIPGTHFIDLGRTKGATRVRPQPSNCLYFQGLWCSKLLNGCLVA